jgi:hypothetical protein
MLALVIYAAAKELPLRLLASTAGSQLKEIPFKIETTESERLTIDHVTSSAARAGSKNPCQQCILDNNPMKL